MRGQAGLLFRGRRGAIAGRGIEDGGKRERVLWPPASHRAGGVALLQPPSVRPSSFPGIRSDRDGRQADSAHRDTVVDFGSGDVCAANSANRARWDNLKSGAWVSTTET